MKQYLLLGTIFVFLVGCGKKGNGSPQEQTANPTIAQDDVVVYWTGPGYYGGYWFDTEEDYNAWYYPYAGLYWTGPGWYGGFWFDTEIQFNDWHGHHRHDHRGHGGHHGGGHHGGGRHGGGHHGGGHHGGGGHHR